MRRGTIGPLFRRAVEEMIKRHKPPRGNDDEEWYRYLHGLLAGAAKITGTTAQVEATRLAMELLVEHPSWFSPETLDRFLKHLSKLDAEWKARAAEQKAAEAGR